MWDSNSRSFIVVYTNATVGVLRVLLLQSTVKLQTRIRVQVVYDLPNIDDVLTFPSSLQAVQFQSCESLPVVEFICRFAEDYLAYVVFLDGFDKCYQFLSGRAP